MRGGGDPLDPVGWASVGGVVKKGVTKSNGRNAAFKHSHEFQIGEVWKMNVEKVRGTAKVGFATENYDVTLYRETEDNTAWNSLTNGTTAIDRNISSDGENHHYFKHLKDHLTTLPSAVALQIIEGNIPQIQFNNDNVWHNFAPDGAVVKPGPWFPYLYLDGTVILRDHSITPARKKPTKSAQKKAHDTQSSDKPSGGPTAGPKPSANKKTRK